jgi:hypothetical protein
MPRDGTCVVGYCQKDLGRNACGINSRQTDLAATERARQDGEDHVGEAVRRQADGSQWVCFVLASGRRFRSPKILVGRASQLLKLLLLQPRHEQRTGRRPLLQKETSVVAAAAAAAAAAARLLLAVELLHSDGRVKLLPLQQVTKAD